MDEGIVQAVTGAATTATAHVLVTNATNPNAMYTFTLYVYNASLTQIGSHTLGTVTPDQIDTLGPTAVTVGAGQGISIGVTVSSDEGTEFLTCNIQLQ